MPISQKIGGLPALDWVYNHSPWFAASIMIVADFGIIALLMWVEGIPPWQRRHYKTFLYNDTIFIPLFMMMAVFMLRDAPKLEGWYTATWFHFLLLAVGFAISIITEIGALKSGQYTLSQELSPSKLWHTFIYGIVFYWLVSVVIPVIVVCRPTWAVLVATLSFTGFVWMCYLDATIKPFPPDAHLEGTWTDWDWHVRKY